MKEEHLRSQAKQQLLIVAAKCIKMSAMIRVLQEHQWQSYRDGYDFLGKQDIVGCTNSYDTPDGVATDDCCHSR